MALSDSAEYWWPSYANKPEPTKEQRAKREDSRRRWKHKKFLEREERRRNRNKEE